MTKAIGSSDCHILMAEDSEWLSADATPASLREYVEDHGSSRLGYRHVGKLTAHAMEGCSNTRRILTHEKPKEKFNIHLV